MKWLDDWLSPQKHDKVVETTLSSLNPTLEVVHVDGQLVLNGGEGNYSFGALHWVFDDIFYKLDFRKRKFANILVLGLGAGSVVDLLRNKYRQDAPIVGVEHDPEVIRLGKQYFGLGDYENLEIVETDAAQFVTEKKASFDLLIVDLYNGLDVPPQFEMEPFVGQIASILAPKGLLIFNKVVVSKAHKTQFNTLLKLFGEYGNTSTLTLQELNKVVILTN